MSEAQPRILILRLSALGDIIHALPALAALRRAMPHAFIGWLVEDRGAALVLDHPLLDRVHIVPRREMKRDKWAALKGPVRKLARELRDCRYDTTIDFQGLSKSSVWGIVAGARRRIGFGGDDAREISGVLNNVKIRPGPADFHIIRRNLALLRPLGIDNPAVEFPVHMPPEATARAHAIWGPSDEFRFVRIVINPGAGWPTKQWPAEDFGRLARELSDMTCARVAISWGPGEEHLVKTALDAARVHPGEFERGAVRAEPIPPGPGVYALPPTTFMELGAVIGAGELYIGGDTGPTHFAAALGVPVLAIFGASDSRRNGPWGDHCRIIQRTDPPCVPCWKTKCHNAEHLACLTRIPPEQVLENALQMLGEIP